MAAIQFLKSNDTALLKACFDALKHNKASEKLVKAKEYLENDEAPMIEALNKEIEQRSSQANRKGNQRACESFKNLFARDLHKYFQKWKDETSNFGVKISTKVKDRIIKVYKDQLRGAFDTWKSSGSNKKIQMQQMVIMDQQSEGA